MSTQLSSNQKQAFSVYTMMLVVSAIALLIACILLYMELKQYGEFPYWNTREATPSTASLVFDSFRNIA